MNILEESQLLKQSKDQLVEVLQNHGFAVTADTPLADVAKYMKWDGGLLDLRVATLRKTNGEYKPTLRKSGRQCRHRKRPAS